MTDPKPGPGGAFDLGRARELLARVERFLEHARVDPRQAVASEELDHLRRELDRLANARDAGSSADAA